MRVFTAIIFRDGDVPTLTGAVLTSHNFAQLLDDLNASDCDLAVIWLNNAPFSSWTR